LLSITICYDHYEILWPFAHTNGVRTPCTCFWHGALVVINMLQIFIPPLPAVGCSPKAVRLHHSTSRSGQRLLRHTRATTAAAEPGQGHGPRLILFVRRAPVTPIPVTEELRVHQDTRQIPPHGCCVELRVHSSKTGRTLEEVVRVSRGFCARDRVASVHSCQAARS